MEMPSRYYFIALGFLKYVEDSAKEKTKVVPDTDSPNDNFRAFKVTGLGDISNEVHVRMLEELFKAIKSSNEYL